MDKKVYELDINKLNKKNVDMEEKIRAREAIKESLMAYDQYELRKLRKLKKLSKEEEKKLFIVENYGIATYNYIENLLGLKGKDYCLVAEKMFQFIDPETEQVAGSQFNQEQIKELEKYLNDK